MDSMRSLNRSLPSSPKRKPKHPPEELLQAFKNAALSVTNLYKQASSSQEKVHSQGYQEAIEDLLAFLDKEDLGLSDGEGWRVRRWATERLHGNPFNMANGDSDEETTEVKREDAKHSTSPSPTLRSVAIQRPIVQPKPSQNVHRPDQVDNALAPPALIPVSTQSSGLQSKPFEFRSSHPFPQDAEMQNAEQTAQPEQSHQPHQPSVQPSTIPSSKPTRLRTSMAVRHKSSKALGSGAGSKRKTPFETFFNLDDLGGDGKENSGNGGKRARLI